jgi:hypothetical protein
MGKHVRNVGGNDTVERAMLSPEKKGKEKKRKGMWSMSSRSKATRLKRIVGTLKHTQFKLCHEMNGTVYDEELDDTKYKT